MLSIPPPVSNVERQRQFRERNPGYFRKYNARKRAIAKAVKARMMAEAQAAAAAAATREPLLLPAPAEPLIFPGLDATAAATPAPAALPLPQTVKIAA